ncbi:cupin domain-containing protein [Dyella sp. 20L07]|uniref:AraC family transcriptional regulator n=1 Tax=Dyella sp. 20L07 TaxID=3384240 RepID=UPI003D28879E
MTTLTPQPDSTVDLASELLLGMRLVGVQYSRIEIAAPFGLRFGQAPGRAQFHFVARGPVFLRSPGNALHRLDTGDAALLPDGGVHALLSAPDVPCQDIRDMESTNLCTSVCAIAPVTERRTSTEDALIFSGCMEFDMGGMQLLVRAMPEVMLVSTLLDRNPELRPMLEAMARESQSKRAGYAGILARLADVVSAFIVRGWVECGCGNASGWVQALRDPRLSRVILALHREPGKDWTVAELAAVMGASRSVFAQRFLAVTGTTPTRYLTELRMQLAVQSIRQGRESIETVAFRLGYGSLAAFSRAFKRIVGTSPAAVRHNASPTH